MTTGLVQLSEKNSIETIFTASVFNENRFFNVVLASCFLTLAEKILLLKLGAMFQKDGQIFPTNKHLQQATNLNCGTVRNTLTRLKKKGFIDYKKIGSDKRRRFALFDPGTIKKDKLDQRVILVTRSFLNAHVIDSDAKNCNCTVTDFIMETAGLEFVTPQLQQEGNLSLGGENVPIYSNPVLLESSKGKIEAEKTESPPAKKTATTTLLKTEKNDRIDPAIEATLHILKLNVSENFIFGFQKRFGAEYTGKAICYAHQQDPEGAGRLLGANFKQGIEWDSVKNFKPENKRSKPPHHHKYNDERDDAFLLAQQQTNKIKSKLPEKLQFCGPGKIHFWVSRFGYEVVQSAAAAVRDDDFNIPAGQRVLKFEEILNKERALADA